nr:MAG TPA: hypothetical protein [Caudoviricetes sp.]
MTTSLTNIYALCEEYYDTYFHYNMRTYGLQDKKTS